mmetsp:Transcript_107562/g.261123  ORF Transcript_107562/g.261123 Transcript_107562/m.261123 type:complete len:184 (-) Transcript_107562:246-797(-)
MGLFIAKLMDSFAGTKERRMLMLGLDGAGKTTMLYKLKLGEVVHTMPTIGFNCEGVTYKNVSFQAWDIGGQDKLRRLWRYYFEGTDAIVWIVDSVDRDRMEEAREELAKLMGEDQLRDSKLLVFANKQDAAGAMTPAQIADALDLHKLRRDWYIQAASALTGDGVHEGLDWLVTAMNKSDAAR